jgi:hypothetical protein
VIAGSYLSIAAVGGDVSPQKLEDLKAQVEATKTTLESNDPNQIGGLTRENLLGDIFYSGTLGYYSMLNNLADIAGIEENAQHYLSAGYGSFGYEPKVDYFFGTPRLLNTGSAVMNIPMLRVVGEKSNNKNSEKSYNIRVGLISSALEDIVPQKILNVDPLNPAQSISAVKAIRIALENGQKLYKITAGNSTATLPLLHQDQQTIDEIKVALSSHKEVFIHPNSISISSQWSGAGYIILDPETGDAAYKISGGLNGGETFVSKALLVVAVSSLLFLTVGAPLLLAMAGTSIGWLSLAFAAGSTNFLIAAWLADDGPLVEFYRFISDVTSHISNALTLVQPDLIGIIIAFIGSILPD